MRRVGWWVLGALLAAAYVGWLWVSASGRPGAAPAHVALMVAAAAAAYIAGRLLGTAAAPAVAGLLAIGTIVALLVGHNSLSGGPLAGPLGYGNADAALYVQGVGAAAVVAVSARVWLAVRLLFAAVAVALTAVIHQVRSSAGLAVAVVILLTALVVSVWRPQRTRLVAAGAVVVFVAAVAATAFLGYRGHSTATVTKDLSNRRVQLWVSAVDLTRAHPVRGTGPDTFSTASSVARRDKDTRYAHSMALTAAAEEGVVGAALLAALAAWTLLSFGERRVDPQRATVGAVALLGFLLEASVDYVDRYHLVVAAAALLAGVTTASLRAAGRRRSTADLRNAGPQKVRSA